MSTKDKVLHSMTRSDVVRRAYSACRSVPVLGAGITRLVRAALPPNTRIWIQIPEGYGQGYWMHADPRFELGYSNGDYEPWIQELLRTELRPGGCYYDVGAHYGFFCLIAMRFLGPSGSVVALEPDPQNAVILNAHVARNNLEQIRVVEAAVWSSAGQMTFEQAAEASNRTQGKIASEGNGGSARISVPAVRLDDLVFTAGHRAPDLIKMDVEGAEWEALQGARRVLTEVKPKWLCEIHDPEQLGQIRNYFEQFGYRAEEWKPVHPHYSDYRQIYLWAVPERPVVRRPRGSEN
jgi:FkbM family methyltransferase